MARRKAAETDKTEDTIVAAHDPDEDEGSDDGAGNLTKEDKAALKKVAAREKKAARPHEHKFDSVIANPADPPKRQVCSICGLEEKLDQPKGFPGGR